jgi:hypothetical protein
VAKGPEKPLACDQIAPLEETYEHVLPRVGALAVSAILLTAAYNRTNSASVMTEAANRFLASLTPEQSHN